MALLWLQWGLLGPYGACLCISGSTGGMRGLTNGKQAFRIIITWFKVAKNTLARRAIKETNFEKLDKFFVGPTSVAFSDDPVGTSKVMINYSKENENLKVIGGVMGDKELTIDEIKKLASLPSMDALRSQILGLLASVQTRIVYSLKDSQSKVVRVISNKPNNNW